MIIRSPKIIKIYYKVPVISCQDKSKALIHTIQDRWVLTSLNQSITFCHQSELKINTGNPEDITYTTEEIAYTILGGIRLDGLGRLRLTIKVEEINWKFRHCLNNPDIVALAIRQRLDLYSIKQVEKLPRLITDRLEVGVTAVSKD